MQHSSVIPSLRYRDAPAAIGWLVRVLGFEKRLVVSDGNNGIGLEVDQGAAPHCAQAWHRLRSAAIPAG